MTVDLRDTRYCIDSVQDFTTSYVPVVGTMGAWEFLSEVKQDFGARYASTAASKAIWSLWGGELETYLGKGASPAVVVPVQVNIAAGYSPAVLIKVRRIKKAPPRKVRKPRLEPVVIEVLKQPEPKRPGIDIVRIHDRLKVKEIRVPSREKWTAPEVAAQMKHAAVIQQAHKEEKAVEVKKVMIEKQRRDEIEALVIAEVA